MPVKLPGPKSEQAIEIFAKLYDAGSPRAVKNITDDQDLLLEFFDSVAEPWIQPRSTNPTQSTFATVGLRIKITLGAGSHAAALAMVFKHIESAQTDWWAFNSAYLVPLVRPSARFERDQLVERPEAMAT
ncbi:hypothetical protein ACIBAI_22715 [Streptomyces sp. NPDC051041]|uniref:hypothetical protein n=1 Tax=Streptomyces sp. NPDC051041 TaxID=3365640 RepID=UPI0037A0E4D4